MLEVVSVNYIQKTLDEYPAYKVCPKCKEKRTVDEFYKTKRTRDGLQTWCKVCAKTYITKNKDIVSKKWHAYYQKNVERIKNYQKEYNSTHKEKIQNDRKQHYEKNRDYILKRSKLFYLKNVDRIRIEHRKYYQNNVEKTAVQNKRLYNRKRELILEQKRIYRKTEVGRLVEIKHAYKRKSLGYEPINQRFKGSAFHHMHLDTGNGVNRGIGIHIPAEIHRRFYHNGNNGIGMREMNKLALVWLSEQSTISKPEFVNT